MQVASNISFIIVTAGTYLWNMIQASRITQKFSSHCWREHPLIAGVINCHLFRFMVSLSIHNKLKEEVSMLKKNELNRQSKLFKLTSRVNTLEIKSK